MKHLGVKHNNEIKLVIAENDYVVVYGSNKITRKINSNFAYMDIFRVRDGYLAEYWDVI